MTEKRFLTLQDITAYQKAFKLSNLIWSVTAEWNYFEKDTVGKQFVRATDSIAANIAEGFGRFHKKDKIHFYRYSYGSTLEAIDWCNKAHMRNLMSDIHYQSIMATLQDLPKDIHHLIAYTNKKLTI